MNILVIHEVSYQKKVVYEYQDFAERLASMGHTVSVIDYDVDGRFAYQKIACSRTGIGTVTLETIPYVNLPLIKYFSGRTNYKKILLEKLKANEIDIVWLYSVFVNGTNTVRLCQSYGIPVVFRALDIYHQVRKNPFMLLPLYLGEKFIYQHADAICVTNRKLEEYIQSVTAGKAQNIEIIHHGVDTNFFYPRERDAQLTEQYHIREHDQVALFLGTTYPFSGVDLIIERFDMLKQIAPNLKIFIVGTGQADAKLRQLVTDHHWEREVILTGFRPYQEIPRFLSLADITFNSFVLNNITRDIVPIKILQYLACGKPVISSPLPDVMALFPERMSGMLYCDIQQPERFITLLAETVQNAALLSELSRNALQFIQNHFTINQQIAHVEQLLLKTVAQKRRAIA